MKQDQYTGKPDEPQGPAPDGGNSDKGGRSFRGFQRASLWLAVAALLIIGLVLYFRYESGIVPLFGGRG